MTKFNKIHKIFKVIITIILSVVILVNLWLVFSRFILKDDLPSVFGYKTAVVLSGSMEPTFSAGDMLIYKEQNEYEINDIIIFESYGSYVTHRIIGQENESFITQGDANNTADQELLSPSQIEGEMILIIPSVGTVINFLTTPLGLLILIFIGVAVFEIPKFFKENKSEV